MNSTGADCVAGDGLTISHAARYLRVSPTTLRNWDKAGKLKPRRHPHSGYRIYNKADLQGILNLVPCTAGPALGAAPQADRGELGGEEHFVQFYESDEVLVGSVSGYIGTALTEDEGGIVIATQAHRDCVEKALVARGVDVSAAMARGQYIALDAADTLGKFMVKGAPDPRRFEEVVGGVVAQLAQRQRPIRAFGEMVALLWDEGNRTAAIRLEQLWNDLAKTHSFTLFCAYPMHGFAGAEHGKAFDDICGCHSRVIPGESYVALSDSEERLRAISRLQQKARSLAAEIAHSKEVEKALANRERELSDFLENAVEGLHQVGPDGIIQWANRAELDLLGYAPAEYVGHHIAEFHADPETIDDMLARLLRGEILYDYPARLRCKDGSLKHVLVHSSAHFRNGSFIHSRCFTRDVTERKKAEEALCELNATLERRVAERTAVVVEQSTRLRELASEVALAEQRERRKLAGLLHDELAQSLALARLKLTTMEAQGPKARHEQTLQSLKETLTDAIQFTRSLMNDLSPPLLYETGFSAAVQELARDMRQHGLEVSVTALGQVDLPQDLRAFLFHAVREMLTNIAKYGATDRATVTINKTAIRVVVEVEDQGAGFDLATLPSRPSKSRGFGLFSIRERAQLLDGRLEIESQPGKGTKCRLEVPVRAIGRAGEGGSAAANLPIENGDPQGPRAASTTVQGNGRVRVVIADDHAAVRESLAMILRSLPDVEVVGLAEDGRQALQLAQQLQPHLVLLDISLPGMDGIETTKRLNRDTPHVGVIGLSMHGAARGAEICRAGAVAYLNKDCDQRVLAEAIRVHGAKSKRPAATV